MSDSSLPLTLQRRLAFFGLFVLSGLLICFFPQLLKDKTLIVLSQSLITIVFIVVALRLRRKHKSGFFEVAFAFFIMSFAFLLLYLLQFSGLFPLSTINGYFAFQIANASAIAVSIVVLTKISGKKLQKIYLQKGKIVGLLVGTAIFVLMLILILLFPTALSVLYPMKGEMTHERALMLMPIVVVFVLSNGIREELWFRAIFLKKLEPFLGVTLTDISTSFVFAMAHIGVNYTPVILIMLGITFLLGLAFAYMMRKTNSVIGPVLFHAAMDIPVVLAIFSFLS